MKLQQGRGKGRDRAAARISVCNQRHEDVLKPLLLAPGKGTKSDMWLFALCLPCPSGWKLPGINGLRVAAGSHQRSLLMGTGRAADPAAPLSLSLSPFPSLLLPSPHLGTEKENCHLTQAAAN